MMFGLRPEYDGLRINPCIPSKWKKCKIRREFRNSIYEVIIYNPCEVECGVKEIVVDDKRTNDNLLPIFSDKKVHKVKVIMGE